jgi:hypothetical protein
MDDFDFEKRTLCGDGACIGVLDDAGNCPECGRTFGGGGPPHRTRSVEPAAAVAAEDGPAEAEEFDPGRELCPTGICLGVLGSDGRCPLCGAARA